VKIRFINYISDKIVLIILLSLAMKLIVDPKQAWAGPASIYYNFSFLSSIPVGGSITGQFEVINGGNGGSFPYTITGITGNVYGFQVEGSNGSIYGLIQPGNFGGNDNWFSSDSPYVTGNGVSFHTNSQSGASFQLLYNGATWVVQDTYNSFSEDYYGTMTTSISQ
jgi:hypothetical protein